MLISERLVRYLYYIYIYKMDFTGFLCKDEQTINFVNSSKTMIFMRSPLLDCELKFSRIYDNVVIIDVGLTHCQTDKQSEYENCLKTVTKACKNGCKPVVIAYTSFAQVGLKPFLKLADKCNYLVIVNNSSETVLPEQDNNFMSIGDQLLPNFCGWFLDTRESLRIYGDIQKYYNCLMKIPQFSADQAEIEGAECPSFGLRLYNIRVDENLHCKTHDMSSRKNWNSMEVRHAYGRADVLDVIGYFITPKTVGIRLSLSKEQLRIWQDGLENESESRTTESESRIAENESKNESPCIKSESRLSRKTEGESRTVQYESASIKGESRIVEVESESTVEGTNAQVRMFSEIEKAVEPENAKMSKPPMADFLEDSCASETPGWSNSAAFTRGQYNDAQRGDHDDDDIAVAADRDSDDTSSSSSDDDGIEITLPTTTTFKESSVAELTSCLNDLTISAYPPNCGHIVIGQLADAGPHQARSDLDVIIQQESKATTGSPAYTLGEAIVKMYGSGTYMIYLNTPVRIPVLFTGHYQ